MKYKYPKISNTLTYRRTDAASVEVVDHITGNIYEFRVDAVRYIKKLDGFTHPYKIPTPLSREEIDGIIEFLKEYDLVLSGDTVRVSFGTVMKTLWVPRHSPLLGLVAYICNALLLLTWLPIMAAGIIMFVGRLEYIEFDRLWVGYVIGLFLGIVFHELGHAFAGISYGAGVFEMGVLVMYCVLPGAYVLWDGTTVKKRLQRIQINAAGVEMNFLLFGALLWLGACFPSLGGMFYSAGACNAFIGVLNLTFIKGLDGTAIVSELLGADDVIDRARNIVFNRRARMKIMRRGPCGYAAVAMCCILLAMQLVLPVLLVTNVLEVISCFV